MKGILLGNLGTPREPTKKEVGKYLKEFLMDPLVIDIPWLFRWFLVNLIIVPFRSKKLAKAYQSVWMQEGSPLLFYSNSQTKSLQKILKTPVVLGMNYGEPNIQDAIKELIKQGVDDILCFPLYPHYALSSYEALRAKVIQFYSQHSLKQLKFVKPFYDHPSYIASLGKVIRKSLPKTYDHILFSYHGIPERHILKADKAGFCKIDANCCENQSDSHQFCYRAQVITTTRLIAKQLNIKAEKYSIAFQSRLGREPWLTPYTDYVITDLVKEKNIQNLVVVCPSFTSDCLETLEEIGIQAKKKFLNTGGKELFLLTCLNNNVQWIQSMREIIGENR